MIDLANADFYWFGMLVLIHSALLIMLALNISRLRIQLKLPYGDGDNKDMKQAIRVHMNGVEHVPVFALLVLALTLLGVSSTWLGGFVIGFTLARLSHAYGMMARHFQLRRLGALLTYLSQLTAVGLLAALLL